MSGPRILQKMALLAAVVASAAHAETTAFVHATVHTASGPVMENATVIVENGRIASVGSGGAPAGAQIVDCSGKHLWPGFVAPWTALGLVEVGSVRGTVDAAETGAINPNVRADVQINPDSELFPVARFNGITSAVVVPSADATQGGISGASALVHLDGWTHEDMTIKAPVALHVQWPAMGISRSFFETRSEEDQKKARDQAIRAIQNAFDDARAYTKARGAEGKSGIPRHDQDVRWEAMGKALPVIPWCSTPRHSIRSWRCSVRRQQGIKNWCRRRRRLARRRRP
jgi:imidazolonepropionase-like amidohydrolase